jgi:membrane protein DedA with SNARE-associated domain
MFMTELIEFLLRHGYVVLFGAVFLEQVGVPIPSAPVLLAAGTLAAHGNISASTAILLALLASLLGDLVWYQLGRRRGHKVLHLICRLSLEPDNCVRRTEDVFSRHGGRVLLVAKFIPGLNTAAPPMAGHLGMNLFRFLIYDLAGSALWVCSFIGIGIVFSDQVEDVALLLARLGNGAVILAVGALAGYLVLKYVQRRRFMRKLRIARISPAELMRKMTDGEDLVIVDLRHELDWENEEVRLPGALHMVPEDVVNRHREIPRDRDIVLYCT